MRSTAWPAIPDAWGRPAPSRTSIAAINRRTSMTSAQLQIPGFVDEVLAEAVVFLVMGPPETRILVEPARRGELTVRPQRHLAIARVPREPNALVHQTAADAETARARIDDQQPQPGDRLRFGDHEHRADVGAVFLRDPAPLPRRIEALQEVGDD